MVTFNRIDLEFVLQQILMAENNQPPVSPHLAFGLREVSGTNNNSVPGQGTFGAADGVFPRVTDAFFRTVEVNIDGTIFDPNPGTAGDVMTTTYASTVPGPVFGVNVVDAAPRVISNLIADQTANNPAALEAQAAATPGVGYLYQSQIFVLNPDFDATLPVDLSNPMFVLGAPNPAFDPALPIDLSNLQYLPSNAAIQPPVDDAGNLFIPNVTPDAGLSAPFNSWFTFFGQFFDHGLDLVTKGGSGTVFIPLQPDDPLITVGPDGIAGSGDEVTDPSLQFMVLTRATNLAGADGMIGTADDLHEGTNTTTPFVDQNQTYSSHPSHQVFLRDYITGADGKLHSTGELLTGADGHSMATWADVKANALKLGLLLTDADVGDVPLLATDAYGNVMLGTHGFAQVVVRTSNGVDGIAGTNDDITILVEGTAGGLNLHDAVVLGGTVVGTGHAFLNDISPTQPLNAHYIAGDGRANENIALTAIHDIFHAEHNRQIEVVKAQIQAELDNGDTSFAGNWVLAGVDLTVANGVDINGNPVHIIQADEWNGERLFQVAKFSTETQYQHLVFEEFARKVSPNIHLFGNNDIHLDPAITAEFAHAVYRFGHSMLDENVNRYEIGADGTPVLDATGQPVLNAIGLIDAFLNPLEFAAHGATATGEIVLGSVNQVANEIDEFVTGALRNNLLGLPLDLAAINLARGRDAGVAPLNLVRNQIFTELNTGGTQDTTMKPYASWDEFGQFLKHAGSLVNFVAAYGTHASIIGATTLIDKRAAALELVANAVIGSANFDQDAYDFMHSLGAYANDINNPLAVHAQWSTGSITGLDTVDLWIGGLAEKQNLFGGLLGSTFNFIFENQMEAIQDGDRLYYLPRIEGIHFGTEIESNTFADLIMRNTGTHHLSANIFMTPEYVVEAGTIDPLDSSTWLRNAVTGNLLVEVLTDEYVDALFGDGQHHAFDTQVHFLGDDNFFGNTMVLGGTEGRDVLIAGQADDDTVYGDGGDDWLDGGNGNDVLFGGAGNDIIRDSAGDDVIHGGTGNDNIDGGLGDDEIFGEDGDDLIHGGNSILGDGISGGTGNDIIFGDEGDDEMLGNEGDDWIEGGTGADILVGDVGAPTGQVPLYSGNDVLDGGDQGDKMVGFSGDDIMLGLGGFDKFYGRLGFDWASWENETHGVSVDMERREFIPDQLAPAGDAVRDFFIETEAASGSAFDDVLRGTDVARVDTFNELINVNLIFGLAEFFPEGPVAFSDGNIMLGGDGSDFIDGRGGNDIIDGDAYLHVELTRDVNGHIFAGSQIVREILYDLSPGDIDTAVFTGNLADYTINFTPDAQGFITVTDNVGTDGTDRLRNVERLQFADVTIGGTNNVPTGTVVVNGTAQVGQVLTADPAAIVDADGIASPISYQWQYEIIAAPGGTAQWVDIHGATGVTFAPTDFYVGNALRVVASFTDGQGFTERLFSAPTAALVFDPAVNHAPTVVTQVAENGLFDTTAHQDQPITLSLPLVTTFTDDQTPAANLIYTATLADGSALATAGLEFVTTPDGAGGVTGGVITGTPPAGFFGTIDIRVTATDAQGLAVSDTFTINVLPTDGISTGAIALGAAATSEHTGVEFNRIDLEFVLQQILMAENNQPPVSPHLAFGLREVSGTNNNSVPGQGTFGAADGVFPRVTDAFFRTVEVNIDGTIFDPNPGTAGDVMTTTYASTVPGPVFGVNVVDAAPRVISNLIADQTANNPAALEAQAAATPGVGYLYQSQIFVLNPDFDATLPVDLSNPMFVLGAPNPAFDPALPIDLSNLQYLPSNAAIQPPVDDAGNLFIPNVTPDAGLSAPFNSWFTFFGQFFDHGLDLVTKGGSGTVFIPLQPDDPLITVGPDGIAGSGDEVTDPSLQFMVLTRATNLAGADGMIGTADDLHEGTNTTTPFVDQNQTYSSHPSHQVFLRDYITGADGKLHSTGELLTGADGHSMATWADVKANALKLGLLLTDADVGDVPLLATDAYGNVMLGTHGFAQVVVRTSNGVDGIAGTNDDITILVEGTAGGLNLHDAVVLGGTVVGTGHAFLNDISPTQPLNAHYIAGDGRANENIALTAIHDIFHAEHNRQIEVVKAQIQAELDNGDTSFAGNWVLAGVDLTVANGVDINGNPVHIIQADEWNGERLFQVAKFSTETQYQHLVFEEFARKVSPNIHLFGNNDIHLDPAITAEFAHAVYRFGHSMLDENVNRYEIGADGTPVLDATGQPVLNAIGLIDAFLNPLEFAAHGATATGEIVLGSVNQVANEIDEFVTGALRNNLLGLPLDLAAINLARGRDAGVAPLNLVRNQIFTELNTGGTQDTTMKPYASWDEFGQFLKHAGSLVNFVAAYGTHASIIGATTLIDKRAAALELVANAVIGSANFDQDAYDFMHSLGAYANDINNPLAVHAQWSTGSITGLDTVDLWIGGLAEKQNLFGGLLGSTFNFIFENQMEAIQDGDRLYYLPRIEGIHFGTEIESNTFADLIMRNTGTHHLSANIFMTPEYVVEAGTIDPLDSSTWLRNAVTGNLLVEVLTDEYVDALFGDGQHHAFDTQVHFLGDDNFFGNTMVLGGTEGRDVLIAGQADDDTVYGDGGDDWLDGGNGNDVLFGGAGNDIIRDSAGDDVIHGGTGNDNIDGGLGDDEIFGEDGDDLIHGGNSILGDGISGGTGNDIIFGDEGDDEMLGNEGDDWIEGGTGADILVGDVGAPTGQVPLYSGNDVLDGGDQGDKMVGFSGDDIMLGLGGFDKFYGRLGFDWASWENETHGVSVDMERREFIPDQLAPAGDAVRDFFIETEAASGSAFDDVLRGTDVGQVQPGAAPRLDPFNELVNVDLIDGLDRYFPGASTGTPVAFSDGNIMLGGGGSDFIEGRGGNDIIDGDARLHVELTRDANGDIFAGSQIVREILIDQAEGPTFGDGAIDFFSGLEGFGVLSAGDIDTAVFGDVSTAYTIELATDANGDILFGSDGNPVLRVTHITPTAGAASDGIDLLHNIERLQFADVTFDTGLFTGAPVADQAAQGALTIDNTAPAVGNTLTASSTINDFEGVTVNGVLVLGTFGPERGDIPLQDLNFQWQYQIVAAPGGTSQWVDIAGATEPTFVPTDFYVGFALRVVASFIDGLGVKETVFSAPTALLVTDPAVNHAPTVVTQVAENGLFDTSAQQDQAMTLFLPLVTTFTDDQTPAANLIYTATLADGSALSTVGLTFTTTPDGAGGVTGGVITGTPPAGFFGTIDIRVKATDAGGLAVTDTFTINVLPNTNRAPAISSDGGGATAAVSVAENSLSVTTVTAVDPNIGDVLTFSIAGGADAGKFSINASTGALSFVTAPNFEAPTDDGNNNVYDVVVQVSDGTVIDTQAIAVTVTNVNEAPVITSNGAGVAAAISVAENSTAVTTVTATDPDAGATLTFSLAGGADVGKFTINATTGALSFIAAPDFEAPTDAGANNVYDVLVQASDGSLIDTQAIAVTVTNVAGLTLTGTAAANTLTGGSEEDLITGLGGADLLSGLGGNDTITGGTGNDIINAGAGNDLILYTIGDGADTVLGDVGLDTLTVTGTAAADTLTVAFDGAALTGVAGGTLSGVETITADLLGGSDTLSYGTTTAAVTVDLTTTSASGFTSIVGIENVTGGAGGDTLIGDGLANALNGGTGNDTLSGGLGVDTLTGGAGTDTVSYVDETDALVISLATGTTQRGSAAAPVEDVLVTIENVIGGLGSDSITGSTGNNLLDGGTGLGNDSIDGGSGNDTLMGGDGNDQLFGGIGTDSIDGGAGNDAIVGGAGNDTLLGGAGNDSFSYTFGDGVDSYSGGTGADSLSITGTAANNALSVIFDGTSITSFTGGTIGGIETLTVDLAAGTDTLSYAGTTVDVSVDLAGQTASGISSLLGVENVTAGAGNDTLTGDAAANILAGGAGNDTYFVGAGDTVTEGAGAGTDTVNSTATFTLGANVENLNLTALASINGTGNALANVIADTAGGNNVLSGLGGNDTITGGTGDDTMSGGTGNDVFVFHANFGNDVITDFDANPTGGQDLLDISAYALTAATFAAHVSIVASGGNTLITIDGTDHFTLVGVNGVVPNIITSQDFIL